MKKRIYAAIDLKSFYASVECIERNLDPLATNLVVADQSRTEKTICLAVSPALKSYGIPGRARLFEVIEKVREANRKRLYKAPGRRFAGASFLDTELKNHPEFSIDYIVAPPRMAHYMEQSARIYDIYLQYVAPEDIHSYSIDEVFIDITDYLGCHHQTPKEFVMMLIQDVLKTTGITATAGIGSNLYLAKIAMDIWAKHIPADENGVRIAELDEMNYRRLLWSHRPITDFWRVGRGYAKKLEQHGIFTMGDVARCSVGNPMDAHNEELLYNLFGINAELLIDHAWGWEPCTIADIKAYRPSSNSIGGGQVLEEPYDYEHTRLVVREMADQLALDLVAKRLMTKQLVLTVGYDIENINDKERRQQYRGEVTIDRYGRKIPKHARETENLEKYTSSSKKIVTAVLSLFDRIVDKNLLTRRLTLSAENVKSEDDVNREKPFVQLDLFSDPVAELEKEKQEEQLLKRERRQQEMILSIKEKFGKNSILKGMNLQKGATARNRNSKIGGHKA